MSAAAILAELPALPLHTAGKYVVGAYVVLFAMVLIYVAIMAIRLSHLERDLGELIEREQLADGQPSAAAERGGNAERGGTGDGERPERTLA